MPEPVLMSIAAAVATKAVAGLYQLVKAKFADDPVATAALEAAAEAGESTPELDEALEQAAQRDPEFGEQLRTEWEKTSVTQTSHIANQLTGNVSGKVLLAGDIQGGVHM